jgi:peroxiredoxin
MRLRFHVASLLVVASLPVAALDVGDRVDNFRLLDQAGRSQELHYQSDATAVLLVAHRSGCALPLTADAEAQLAARGARAFVVAVAGHDARDAAQAALREAGLQAPLLLDEAGIVTRALGFARNGDAVVTTPRQWQVTFAGPVSAAIATMPATGAAGAPAAEAAMPAAAAAAAAPPAAAAGDDCALALPAAHVADYATAVAPLLIEHCVPCHREGGIGPWAMNGYDMVRGYSLMMREVIRTQRMPPWHADPHIGTWQGDRGLSPAEVRTLVDWIEAGAPRGDGDDPLAAYAHDWPQWSLAETLGEPDFVVTLPAFDVPATGTVDYQFPTVDSPLDRDAWVRAIEVLPGERSVVHHVIAGFGDGGRGRLQAGLGGYVPGGGATVYPEDTGVLLPKGTRFVLQMHYTTSGRAVTDVTRMGVYLHRTPPKYPLRSTVLADPTLRIPPYVEAHTDSAARRFDRDVLLYSLLPHAHYRGRASRFTAIYPDGREEVLLSVPRYDFNWQHTYEFAQPKLLPAGTRLVHSTTWDNSAKNPANPDPSRAVPWGQQSWDEMLYGAVRYRYVGETTDDPLPASQRRAELRALLDRDADGELGFSEVAGGIGRLLGRRFRGFGGGNDDAAGQAETASAAP